VAKVLLLFTCFKPFVLENGRRYGKKHSVKSIERANIYQIHFVLFSCISFRSQVMRVWENEREQYLCHWWYCTFIITTSLRHLQRGRCRVLSKRSVKLLIGRSSLRLEYSLNAAVVPYCRELRSLPHVTCKSPSEEIRYFCSRRNNANSRWNAAPLIGS